VATSLVSLRNRPLPEDVEPFKTIITPFGDAMDSISEPNSMYSIICFTQLKFRQIYGVPFFKNGLSLPLSNIINL